MLSRNALRGYVVFSLPEMPEFPGNPVFPVIPGYPALPPRERMIAIRRDISFFSSSFSC